MNRNTNARFELAPQAEIERSTMPIDIDIKTSFDVGELIPLPPIPVMPGDTFDIKTAKVLRLQTLITPVMDNLYLDTYYFFVPNRLVWEHWKNLMGENSDSAWIPEVQYSVPQVYAPTNDPDGNDDWSIGTIADYMGLPVNNGFGQLGEHVSALPFRAYALIVDEWFRDENLQQPVHIPKGDAATYGSNGSDYVTDLVKGGKPFIACKYHDYFTSALPSPMKMEPISLFGGMAPVITSSPDIWNSGTYDINVMPSVKVYGQDDDGEPATTSGKLRASNSGNLATFTDTSGTVVDDKVIFGNLYADLNTLSSPFTINDLRQAFAIQRIAEADARSGSRYIEVIRAHFGIVSPDARMQRPEYLGGSRVPLNIEQVTQTQATSEVSPLGTQAGWSQTSDVSDDVHKSFTEHGYIIPLVCARYDHSYQQGVQRHWHYTDRFHFYWPKLAHLGEQAVYQEEIYGISGDDYRTSVFGYQEAWAEYRYFPNQVTGQMRSSAEQSLDIWHFADDYAQQPTLSSDWIKEDKTNVDRTLAVSSSTANQIFGDILITGSMTRPMPLYSIPGLIDHF